MYNHVFTIGENPKKTLTTYILNDFDRRKRPLVIVCPGGGFLDCSPTEGECVAMHFNRAGYHAAVLIYSTAASAPGRPAISQSLFDMAEAMCLVRQHAEEWNVDSEKIIILGFSAGANLCGLYGNLWNNELLESIGTSDERKPNAVVLCYPPTDLKMNSEYMKSTLFEEMNLESVTGQKRNLLMQEFWKASNIAAYGKEDPTEDDYWKYSAINFINQDTPPTFLWHTFEDEMVSPLNSIDYAKALFMAGIPCDLHVYQKGRHGLSLADKTSAKKPREINSRVATWAPLAVTWLEELFD